MVLASNQVSGQKCYSGVLILQRPDATFFQRSYWGRAPELESKALFTLDTQVFGHWRWHQGSIHRVHPAAKHRPKRLCTLWKPTLNTSNLALEGMSYSLGSFATVRYSMARLKAAIHFLISSLETYQRKKVLSAECLVWKEFQEILSSSFVDEVEKSSRMVIPFPVHWSSCPSCHSFK